MKSESHVLVKIQDPEISLHFSFEIYKRYSNELQGRFRTRFLAMARAALSQKMVIQREKILRETSFIMTEDQISQIRNIPFLESHLKHMLKIFPMLISYMNFVNEDSDYKEIFDNKSDLIRKAVSMIKKRLICLKSNLHN